MCYFFLSVCPSHFFIMSRHTFKFSNNFFFYSKDWIETSDKCLYQHLWWVHKRGIPKYFYIELLSLSVKNQKNLTRRWQVTHVLHSSFSTLRIDFLCVNQNKFWVQSKLIDIRVIAPFLSDFFFLNKELAGHLCSGEHSILVIFNRYV